MSPKLKALLATGRISNLPTVWCNCLVASLILLNFSPSFSPWLQDMTSEHGLDSLTQFATLAIYLIITSSCIYVGGCFLGDFKDRHFDTKHKAERPIPSGVLKASYILFISIILLAAPLISPFFLYHLFTLDIIFEAEYLVLLPAILYLIVAVVSYSLIHKKLPQLGLPLIGLCRFSLIIFASAGASLLLHSPYLVHGHSFTYTAYKTVSYFTLPIILYASAVCIYTIAFASVARTESSDSPITWRNLLRYTMLALPLLVLVTNRSFQIETAIAFITYALWLSYSFSFLSTNKGNYVSKCLAGFCLLDACFVAQFGFTWVIICLILFLLSLALQKIAPAT